MTITWEQVLAFLCKDQTMAITSLLFLAFFAAVALIIDRLSIRKSKEGRA